MLCRARIRIKVENAELIAKALKPDDPEWCKSYARDDELIVEIVTPKIESLINACDDYFLTIKAAIAAKGWMMKS